MRRTWLRAFATALAVAGLTAQPLLAWSQLYNAYPNDPQSCTDPGGYCVRWAKTSGNLSTTHYVYLSANLASGNLDLRPDIRNAIGYWNGAPARNPYLVETTSLSQSDIDVYRGDSDSYCGQLNTWACTAIYADTANGSHILYYAGQIYSDQVTWNHSLTYSPGYFVADSRKVTTHEMGHVEALGHTSFTAVMHTGAESFYRPQTNDIQGIQAIYGAYP
jgi:hypothetical protein